MTQVSRGALYVSTGTLLTVVLSGQLLLENAHDGVPLQFGAGLRGAALFVGGWVLLGSLLLEASRRRRWHEAPGVRTAAALVVALVGAAVAQVAIRYGMAQAVGWEQERSMTELLASHFYLNVAVAGLIVGAGQTAGQRPSPEVPTRAPAPPRYMARFTVLERGVRLVVPVADVEWLESAGNYVRLHTSGRVLMIRDAMSSLDARLDPARFVRIHRRAIVNVQAVHATMSATHGELTVVLRSGTRLTASRTYVAALRTLLK